ncbi:coenzyme F420-0:L-glutamate ligase [Allorhizobium pseudoryzae]|uniref:coenzyme F420-0:L-glutamate ligase n=1 Tax=Allorhizobium pseudoryzae TaxID=379684 RepID=UPI003D03D3F3
MASSRLELLALKNFPLVQPGDDLARLILGGLKANGIALQDDDILVLAQKIVSKAEGRYVDLRTVTPSERAIGLAETTGKDARLVEVILEQSRLVLRHRFGVLIVEHELGLVMAQAGVDQSNISEDGGSDLALLLPEDPDASAARLRDRLQQESRRRLGLIINDSFGRAWRRGVVGVAIGAAGVEALVDRRGDNDLFGRRLNVTEIAFADEVAAAASILMGQADEGMPVVLVRGLARPPKDRPAADLIRPASEDLFR